MIILSCEKARASDLDLKNYFQDLIRRIKEFFKGSDEELDKFLDKHGLELRKDCKDIDELINDSQIFLENLRIVFEKDIGKFSLDFVNCLIKTQSVLTDDFLFSTFDLSEYGSETRKRVFEVFFEIQSASLIDFRSFEEDLSKLYLVYNRRGFFDELSCISYKLTKKMVSIQIGKEDIKYYNYILADFIKKIAVKVEDIEFGYTYSTGKTELLSKISAIELLNGQSVIKAKAQARSEIKKENNLRRGSLKAESFEIILNKEATSQIKQTNFLDESIEIYSLKEIEKVEQRLKLAKNEFESCYKYINSLLQKDIGIIEALNIAKQKFSSEHTLNLAGILITKDVVNVNLFKDRVFELESEFQKLQESLENKEKVLKFQEESIANLKQSAQKAKKNYEKERVEIKNSHLKDIKQFQNELNLIQDEFKRKNSDFEQAFNLLKTSEDILKQKDEELNRLKLQIEILNEKNSLKDDLILSLKSQIEQLKSVQDEELEF